jgi:trigger factor
LNIQTERLENHTARFTVGVDVSQIEKAKQNAARRLSQKVNLPGFRKGKAPYRIIQQYMGEAAILEEALDEIGNNIYKDALAESGIEPYGPGSLEDFKLEPEPVFTFIVPMQPTANLRDYRTIRLDYEAPVTADSDVDKAMQSLLEDKALYEDSQRSVELGNRVTMELYAKVIDEGAAESATVNEIEAEHTHDETGEHDHDHDHHDHGLGGGEFIHEHEAVMMLNEDSEEPAPGFKQALVGAANEEERRFELTFPDDTAEYEDFAGKRAEFLVRIKKIETVTLPVLNDDFAARVTENEEQPLTLLELRVRLRENLEKTAEQRTRGAYGTRALDIMVDQASIAYPEVLVEDQIEEYLQRLDQDFRRQGLTLEDYMRIGNRDRDSIKEEYRDVAIRNIKRGLVLRELREVEGVAVDEAAIEAEIDTMLGQFGTSAASLRAVIDTPSMRQNIKNDLLEKGVMDRVIAIAKGEAPELNAAPASEEVAN